MTHRPWQRLTGNGWDEIDQRFIRWHHHSCAVITYKAERVECDCGLEAALRAAELSVLNEVEALHHGATHEYADGYNNGVKAAVRAIRAAGHLSHE